MTIIDRLEIEHVVSECTTKRLPDILGNLFVTNNIEFDDIFMFNFQTDYKFYVNVFKCAAKYCVNKIEKGRVDEILQDVIFKIKCDGYTNSPYELGMVNRDYIACHFIEELLLYTFKVIDTVDFLDLVELLLRNEEIDPDVIKFILLKHTHLLDIRLLSELIRFQLYTPDDIIDFLIEKNKSVDYETIHSLVQDIFIDRDMFISFVYAVFNRFEIDTDTHKVRPYTRNKNEIQLLNDLRNHIHNMLYVDGDLEMYTMINNAYVYYLNKNNRTQSNLYNAYLLWIAGKENEVVDNFMNYGFEEPIDLYEEEVWHQFTFEAFIKDYIHQINDFGGYDLFVLLFNINRFKILHHNQMELIHIVLSELAETEEGYYIQGALDNKMYLFLNSTK